MDFDIKKVGEVVNYWGDKMPMLVMEEAGELIQAISKVERKEDRYLENEDLRNNLIAEIRDMYISLRALQYYYGLDTPTIETAIHNKLNKKY